jgi:DNA primase
VSGRIPQDFIDDLIQRADIVEVIGSRVPLTKAGREYKARCPFHGEKTPSFTVSPVKGFYHCFGCGAHGTALGFLMEFERLEFPAAVEELARQVGVELPQTGGERQNVAPLLAVLEQAERLYRQALKEHPAAIEYVRGRGLDGATARDFGIGYAPPAWDTVLSALGSAESDRQTLLSAGLIIARDGGGYYDRFRDRIMFPIRDSRGRIIGFGGRIIGDGEPKYLNSPETPVFHKGTELYGLYEARRAVRHPERLLVVEGYMDVASLAAHGIYNAVATLGTATTAEHLKRLFSVVPEVIFCFDGDRAGREAAWRALQVSLPALRDGRQVKFLLLPDGEDPDSLVRQRGATAFGELMANSLTLSNFMLETLARDADLGTADGKARFAALARPLLAQIPDGVYREILTAAVAGRIGLTADRLGDLLDQRETERSPHPAPAAERTARPRPPTSARGSLARQAIAILLHYPAAAAAVQLPANLREAGQRGIELVEEIHAMARDRPDIRPAGLLERFRGRPELPHLEQLLANEPMFSEEGAATELAGCLERLRVAALQQKLAGLLGKAGTHGLSVAERAELTALQQVVAAGPASANGPADEVKKG